jgi:hypothetical protein
VGSIIEYKYTLHYGQSFSSDLWVLQQPLYALKASFRFKPALLRGRIAWEVAHWNGAPPERKGDGAELELQNVPAFHGEEYMPPEDRFRALVRFYYLPSIVSSSDKFWELVGQQWAERIEHFIGNHEEARKAAAEAIGNETDPEKQLRKLYARAQEIRNLTYERRRTAEERKKEDLKPNENVADVLRRGYGSSSDITATFVALARAAGFQAWYISASNRQNGTFEKATLSSRQLSWHIAKVKLKDHDIFLDPGTRFCPFGLLRWIVTSTDAMLLDKNQGTFFVTPDAQQNNALVRRTVIAALTEDGTLKGDVKIEYFGTDALDHRIEALYTDDAGRKKNLEEEFKASLPAGEGRITLKDVQGWEATEEPLIANFGLEIRNYAALAGKRLVVPSFMFRVKQKNAFSQPERKYPVYFPYAFSEVDTMQLTLPSGFSMENPPRPHLASLGYAHYEDAFQATNERLVMQRVLQVNGILFNVDLYPALKDFFTKVSSGDEQEAVLRRASADAEKGNQ